MIVNKADILKYKAIRTALLEEKAELWINFRLLNNRHSPCFDPWENVLPLVFTAVFSLIIMFSANVMLGMLFLFLGMIGYLKFFPIIMKNVMKQRVLLKLTKNINEFEKLWALKGIVIFDTDNPRAFCRSPEGDWKDFVVINFAEFMTDNKENSKDNNE